MNDFTKHSKSKVSGGKLGVVMFYVYTNFKNELWGLNVFDRLSKLASVRPRLPTGLGASGVSYWDGLIESSILEWLILDIFVA